MKSFSSAQISRAYGRSRWLRGYVIGKLLLDPVFSAAWRFIVYRGRFVIDIGCGIGLLGISMRGAGLTERYLGSDITPWKVNKAKDAMRYFGFENVGFEVRDALAVEIPAGSTICMFDVLHYLQPDDQRLMLERLARAAERDSLVLIRTTFRNSGWRYWVTLAEEVWTRATGWIPGGAVNFPDRGETLAVFEDRGLRVAVEPLWGYTPFGGHLIVVEREGGKSPLVDAFA